MLSVNQINKSYQLTTVLQDVSFNINRGEYWGLVGLNGSGKSTLLRILAGEEKSDSGSFRFTPTSLRVGYLPQGFHFPDSGNLGQFIDAQGNRLDQLTKQLGQLSQQLAASPADLHLQECYDDILSQMNLAAQHQDLQPATLARLGFGSLPADTPLEQLSGGQKTRLMLAGVLLNHPDLLLLDEPTNHLDMDMLIWLEDWIRAFNGGVLLVSHDRAFLNHTVSGILELDEHSHTIRAFAGDYDAYLNQKNREREQQWQAFKDQQLEIKRLRRSSQEMRSLNHAHKGGKTDPQNTDGFSIGFFSDRGKEVVQKAKNMEKRVEKLLNEEKIDKPARSWALRIDFRDPQVRSKEVLVIRDLQVGYPGLVLIDEINLAIQFGQHIALTGANGCGKTSLLKTITGQIPPSGGELRLGSSVHLGLMSQEQGELDPSLTVLETTQTYAPGNQTELRSFLSKFLFTGDEVFATVGQLSYGERARLILAGLVASGCNFLLLDEPINHLDIPSRSNFEQALTQFEGSILAVIHDRYFIRGFAHQIWEVQNQRIRVQTESLG